MCAGTHEYMSPLSSSEGVRIVIHPPDTEPYPHTEGFDVPPGYSATFGVKVSFVLRSDVIKTTNLCNRSQLSIIMSVCCYQPPAIRWRAIMYSVASVFVSVCNQIL